MSQVFGCDPKIIPPSDVVLAFHIVIQDLVEEVMAFDGLNDFVSSIDAPRFSLIEANPRQYTVEVRCYFFLTICMKNLLVP